MYEVTCRQIGVISTPFKRREDTPIQSCFAPESRGHIELFPEYAEGLKDIDGFSHLILIYCFHQAQDYELLTKPFLDAGKKGVFATRYFKRPNFIGLSVVRLIAVHDNTLDIAEVDMLDGTPLLDIKPYVHRFDVRKDTSDGWFKTASEWSKYDKPGNTPTQS